MVTHGPTLMHDIEMRLKEAKLKVQQLVSANNRFWKPCLKTILGVADKFRISGAVVDRLFLEAMDSKKKRLGFELNDGDDEDDY
jgi:hypothetical protein